MIDILMTIVVVIGLGGATLLLSTRYPSAMRPWLWVALLEYLLAASAQMFYSRIIAQSGDAYHYGRTGAQLANLMGLDLFWSSGELFKVLIQQPSAYDALILGAGTNTGSMTAASAFLAFIVGGSETAVQTLISGLSMFAAIELYRVCQSMYPSCSKVRLFAAMVLFPSIAFWTSALHKETFCIIGTAALFSGWHAGRERRIVSALIRSAIGIATILIFRAPALPPLILGIVVYTVVEQLRKSRGKEAALIGPAYLFLGLGALSVGMVLVSRVSPSLALDKIADSVASRQESWGKSVGGSSFDDYVVAQSPLQQLANVPLALINALLRPQLFDVTNPLMLISAIEMTIITWMIYQLFRLHGARGLVDRVLEYPLLIMCTVVTLVGCTFVGLTTLNFGSLARYRVPFLPFYGALLAILTEVPSLSRASRSSANVLPARIRGTRLRGVRGSRDTPKVLGQLRVPNDLLDRSRGRMRSR